MRNNNDNPPPGIMYMLLELNLKAKPIDIPLWLKGCIIKQRLVGSRAICVPPPTDTDIDFLCLVDEETEEDIKTLLVGDGFKLDGNYPKSKFQSYKKGVINIILTSDKAFYESFVIAMLVCKELNVLDKQKRIAVHDLIMKEHK